MSRTPRIQNTKPSGISHIGYLSAFWTSSEPESLLLPKCLHYNNNRYRRYRVKWNKLWANFCLAHLWTSSRLDLSTKLARGSCFGCKLIVKINSFVFFSWCLLAADKQLSGALPSPSGPLICVYHALYTFIYSLWFLHITTIMIKRKKLHITFHYLY